MQFTVNIVAMKRRFHLKDLSEIVMGSFVLAFPVALSEEVWDLGSQISGAGAIVIGIISLALISWYNFHAHYETRLDTHGFEFVLRVCVTYAITLAVCALILSALNHVPLDSEPMVAINRMIVVAAPGSSAATVLDSLR